MITTSTLPNGDLLVTFMVDDARPISLVADFNNWDPKAHPLVEEVDGQSYVTVQVPAGSVMRFRYLAGDGEFFDDPDADRYEPNGYGQTHSILDTRLRCDPATNAADASRTTDATDTTEDHDAAPLPPPRSLVVV
jgi:1,4-alpha-glucan branching enzyme